jgi:hypothetical protein
MHRGCGEGSWSDLKRRFLKYVESLFEFDSSDVVLSEYGLHGFRLKNQGRVGVEKQFEKLAEKQVQSFVPRSKS